MKPLLRRLACVTAFLTNAVGLWGQAVFTESFKGTTADGWVFGGNYTPNLTANTIDAPGDGWLRLTDNATNRATYAFLDTEIFSVNAQINITMEYAFYNGSGADGITFFLVDGGINASTFDPGSYGGSMGYAQRTGESGMAGGYLGFALDNFGNYSNASEGRNGGLSTSGTLYPNRVAVRGPESSGYEFIAASSALPQQMDFPTSTTRPDQTGADYRAFQIVLDANNQLEVFMKFGASNDFSSVFTADLSGYERPETFKLGFTGATGDSTEIHEIRNLQVTTTPFQEGAFEWDDGGGSDNSAGTAANWVGDVLPTDNSDILFGSKPAANSTQVVDVPVDGRVRSLTFDSSSNYQLVGAGELTLGNSLQTGKPSINVNEYNNAYARHKIDNDLRLAEELRINNYSLSTLCLNGTIQTVYDDNLSSSTNSTIHDIIVNGHGAVNFNGDILGSGDLIKNGSGITTINNNNADGSSWSGDVKINAGQVVVTTNGALGNTTGTTTVADGATLTFRGGVNYTTAEAVTITGRGVSRGIDQSAGALHNDGGNNTFAGSVTLAGNAAVGSREGTLTLTGALGGGSKNLTKVGAGTVSIESASGGLYSGAFIIEEGALRFNASSFSTAMNYNLAGGVLEIGGDFYTSGAGDVAMNLGTGNNAIRWTGDGGFSATGADRTIYLNYNTSAVTWGSTANFVGNGSALLFGSTTSTHTATLMNGITLGSQQREIRVANGSGVIDGGIAGAITGTGGIIKTGEGTLNLTGSNTYSGATEIKAGALRGNVSTASNLQLNGGVREVSANTSLTLGTAGGNVRWTGDGGFAAAGAASSLTLNSGASLTWGTTSHFVGASNTLTFGSVSASNTLTLTNSLALGTSGTRTIRTIQGTNSSVASGALSGVVSGSAALSVTGNGRLDFTGVNTNTGLVTIAGSEVRLTGAGTMVSVADSGSTAGFTVQQGGRLYLDNSGSTLDRIGNATDIALNGGRLDLIGRTNSTATTETVGVLKLTGGENQINVQRAGSNATVLAFDSLSRSNGATLEFTNDSG
ncbi:MAG: autotransporter-associated beta strand repeat-containing protein, partial [Rariglobus sp.]